MRRIASSLPRRTLTGLIGMIGMIGLLALPAPARAQMQCEGRLVEYGATIAQVLDLCGEPTQRVRSERTLTSGLLDSPGSEVVTIPVEQWTYDQPGQFSRKLVFESGKLIKVESGGYPDLKPQF